MSLDETATCINAPGFEARAPAFLEDLRNGQGFVIVHRKPGHNVHELKVGIGRHEGLVYKEGLVAHTKLADEIYLAMLKSYQKRGYEPYGYDLVRPNFLAADEKIGVVQDYFTEPSLSEFHSYFDMLNKIKQRARNLERGLNPHEVKEFHARFMGNNDALLRCEILAMAPGQRIKTIEDMTELEGEFYSDTEFLGPMVKSDNVIVLTPGKPYFDKTRLAIIDY